MNNKILALPLKQTAHVSIEREICNIIDQQYHQSASNFSNQLRSVDNLRNQILSNDPNLQTIVILKKYYSYIFKLEQKFPQGLEFIWTNCFKDSNSFTERSFRFELISILYQISAIYTILASREQELKTSGVYFQYAAGCLEAIFQNLESNGEFQLRYDMNINSIKSLYYLTLAQSQEIFWLKALNDSLRDTVLIRLSTQVSKFYELSYEHSQMSEVFSIDWCNYLKAKALHFEAATLYRYSQYVLQKEKYGEEISYLKQAEVLLQQRPSKCLNPEILGDSKSLYLTISKRLSVAERENNLIHLQSIPNFDEFKKIPGAQLANPILPRELTSDYINENDDLLILNNLVPLSIIELCDKIKIHLKQFIDFKVVNPNTTIQTEIDTFIKDSQIQSQLDSILVSQRLPESIYQYRQKIMDYGFVDKIINDMNKLNGFRVQCRAKLDSIWDMVKLNFQDDESLSSFYGVDKWQLKVLNDDPNGIQLLENFKTFEQYINEGEKGDLIISQQINDLKPFLELFKIVEMLESYVPESKIEFLNPDLVQCVVKLRNLIENFNKLKNECSIQINDIQNKLDSMGNQLTTFIIKEYQNKKEIKEDFIIEKYLREFEREVSKVEQNKNLEGDNKMEFNSQFQLFLNLKNDIKISNDREQALEVLNSTCQGYFDILGNLNQGLEFYNNLKARIEQEEDILQQYFNERNLIKRQFQNV